MVVRGVDDQSYGVMIYGLLKSFQVDLEIRNVRIYSFDFAAAGFEENVVFREVRGDDDEIVIRLGSESARNGYKSRSASAGHKEFICLRVGIESFSEICCDSLSCALKSRSH